MVRGTAEPASGGPPLKGTGAGGRIWAAARPGIDDQASILSA